jgi:hypothetical protein
MGGQGVEFVGGFAGLVGFFGVERLGVGDGEELGCRGEVGLGVQELLADGEDADHAVVSTGDALGFQEVGELGEGEAGDVGEVEEGEGAVGEEGEEFLDDLEFEIRGIAVDEGGGLVGGDGEAAGGLSFQHGATIPGGGGIATGFVWMSRFQRTGVVGRGGWGTGDEVQIVVGQGVTERGWGEIFRGAHKGGDREGKPRGALTPALSRRRGRGGRSGTGLWIGAWEAAGVRVVRVKWGRG